MKSMIFAVLTTVPVLASGQVWLSQGQSQVFEFRAQNPLPPEDIFYTTLGLHFAPGTFTIGEDATVDIFPDTLGDSPITYGIVSLIDPADSTHSVGGGVSWPGNTSPLWPDLQCFIRITMNSGDSQLTAFSLDVTRASDFSIYQEFVVVPEPSSLALSVLASFGFFARRREHLRR